ncbi:putative alpha/beta superfamily hydrolase [Sphingomonas kyeonggiensis]|uniref:alpha/beta hydrolase n=1 Tax=Sphingomonas kyeonggiensis TaxID=1268553 RepID=UPI0027898BDA|nr:alpha/beta hydrolase-fold protein [Sphingomonas kyeonggiensis]MDQ0252399.1 putative alpha/beta superfamily hydrolase [Sphingomonas kyeonggiensis]
MPRLLATSALALCLLAAAPAVHAQTAPLAAPGYVLPDTETWELKSADGYPYQIFVSKPAGPAPEGGWPVLLVLDGNAMFAGFAETRRMHEYMKADPGKTIIVGVGYKTDKAYDIRRIRDFTGGPPPPPWDVSLAKAPYGGWDPFLDFLTGPLRSELDRRYTINRDRQALFGHSLGGLFAIHTLFTRPSAFHALIAASPSLFWHDREMQQEERAFATALQSGKTPKVGRLMVVWGEREETILERWDAEAFVRRMDPLSAYGLRLRHEAYDDEVHITVPARAVTSTLRFAFAWP